MRFRKFRSILLSLIMVMIMVMAGPAGCGKSAGTTAGQPGSGAAAESGEHTDISLIEHPDEKTESADSSAATSGDSDISRSQGTPADSAKTDSRDDTDDVEPEDIEEAGDDEDAEIPVYEDKYEEEEDAPIAEEGSYTSKEDVALYLYTYGELPDNFITKKQAKKLGWSGGSLEQFAPGKCIGGDYFGNYEGLLPEKKGREYHECDIDTLGRSKRGAKRIIYSNDGLIYYTDDHYKSFELLYGEE